MRNCINYSFSRFPSVKGAKNALQFRQENRLQACQLTHQIAANMTSNHEGVSCNSCRKNNFRGLRYKCLICYDYDLCSACYEAGLTSSRHTVNHPMQCIVARNDFDLFYSGESVTSEQPQSLTCPLCGNLGFNEASLLEHVTNEHANSDNDESSTGIVCPICGVETNQLTYDFTTHLTMEHRTPRETIEQVALRGRGGRCHTRASGPRGRRSQHYNTVGGSSPTVRDSSDPFVEILAQLSSVRRAGATQLRQLQMQLQSPSFSPRTATERNEVRIMRRTFQSMNNQLNPSASTSTGIPGISGVGNTGASSHYSNSHPFMLMDQGSLERGSVQSAAVGSGGPSTSLAGGATAAGLTGAPPNHTNHGLATIEGSTIPSSQYLLSSCMKPTLTEAEQQQKEILRADRSLFVQDLLLQVGLLEKIK